MKEIFLTMGKVALVDDEDYEILNRFKWCAHKSRNTFYATRNILTGAGKRTTLRMQHAILSSPFNMIIDHIDGNGLNNQKSNLRFVTHRENLQNYHNHKSKIGYPGVWPTRKKRSPWKSGIFVNGKVKHLGVFKTPEEAHNAYIEACKKYDHTTIAEEPVKNCPCRKHYHTYPRPTAEELERAFPRKPVIDADRDQRDQLTPRLSLRREK